MPRRALLVYLLLILCSPMLGMENISKKKSEASELIFDKDRHGFTRLHWAAWLGRKQVVVIELERGANISSINERGHTPLFLATIVGQKEVVNVLLERGADCNEVDAKGETLLDRVIGRRICFKEEIVKNLILHGARITKKAVIGQGLRYVANNCGVDSCRTLISKIIFIPDFDSNDLLEARSRVITVLSCIGTFVKVRDIRILILSKSKMMVEDMFLILLSRMKRGLEQNCIAQYMKDTPVCMRVVLIDRIYEHTVQQLKLIMEEQPLTKEWLQQGEPGYETRALLRPEKLEEYFGNGIRENISLCFGFAP